MLSFTSFNVVYCFRAHLALTPSLVYFFFSNRSSIVTLNRKDHNRVKNVILAVLFSYKCIKIPNKDQQALLFVLMFYLRLAFKIDHICVCLIHCSPKDHQYGPRCCGCHRNQPSSQPAVPSRCSSSLPYLHPHRVSTSVTLKIRII